MERGWKEISRQRQIEGEGRGVLEESTECGRVREKFRE